MHHTNFRRPLAQLVGASVFLARELTATMRVGLASHRGWLTNAHEPPKHHTRSNQDVVLLVHGLMATAGAFRPMIRAIHACLSMRVLTFSYLPGLDLDGISLRIHELLQREKEAKRVHLVGHSLGGIAARWYVQMHPHDERIQQTMSIASPFRALSVGDKLPSTVVDTVMPPFARYARLLVDGDKHLKRIPHLSIVADRDQMIGDPENGIFPGAPSFTIYDTGHNGALYHQKTFDVVTDEIRKYQDRSYGNSDDSK